MSFATGVKRLLRDNRLRVDSDGTWEIESAYAITGPTTQLDCYGTVDATSGLVFPSKGSTHPDNINLIADQIEVTWESQNPDVGDIWFARVTWKTAGPLEATDDPLEWQWGQNIAPEQVDCDINGNPFLNSSASRWSSSARR